MSNTPYKLTLPSGETVTVVAKRSPNTKQWHGQVLDSNGEETYFGIDWSRPYQAIIDGVTAMILRTECK